MPAQLWAGICAGIPTSLRALAHRAGHILHTHSEHCKGDSGAVLSQGSAQGLTQQFQCSCSSGSNSWQGTSTSRTLSRGLLLRSELPETTVVRNYKKSKIPKKNQLNRSPETKPKPI